MGNPISSGIYTKGGAAEIARHARTPTAASACEQGPIPREAIDSAAFEYFERVGLDVDATRERLTKAAEAAKREAAELRKAAEREAHSAVAAVERVRRDYTSGRIEAAEWRELRGDLEAEREAAEAKLARLTAREAEVIEVAEGASDPAERMAERLDTVRRAIAGEIKSTRDLDAVRAALRATFEQFEVYPVQEPGDEVPEDERRLAEQAKADLMEDVPSVSVDRWLLVPMPRAETIADLEAIAPVLRLRPLDLPGDDDESGPSGGGGSGPNGGGRGPVGPRADFQKNAPPLYSPKTSRIALQTSPIEAESRSASLIG